jgi:hypothetical protein
MKPFVLVAILSVVTLQPAQPVDDMIERLAMCKDSWRDWKNDPAQARKVGELFNSTFVERAKDGSFTPNAKVSVVGLPVLQVYPESVGMGVGFSAVHAEANAGGLLLLLRKVDCRRHRPDAELAGPDGSHSTRPESSEYTAPTICNSCFATSPERIGCDRRN